MPSERKPSVFVPAVGAVSLAALVALSVGANFRADKEPRPRSQKPYVPGNLRALPLDQAKEAADARIERIIRAAIKSTNARHEQDEAIRSDIREPSE